MDNDECQWCTFLNTRMVAINFLNLWQPRVCLLFPNPLPWARRNDQNLHQDGSCAHLFNQENLHTTSFWHRVRRSTYPPSLALPWKAPAQESGSTSRRLLADEVSQ